jgi:hypothetical protein
MDAPLCLPRISALAAGLEICSPKRLIPGTVALYSRVFFSHSNGFAIEANQEVIMTGKRNYFPCVDLKNLHIPLT